MRSVTSRIMASAPSVPSTTAMRSPGFASSSAAASMRPTCAAPVRPTKEERSSETWSRGTFNCSEQRPRGARVRAVDHDARQGVGAHAGRLQRLLQRFGHERSRELGAEALLPLARERLVRRAPDVEELLGGRALAEDDRERLVVGPERERGGAVAARRLARPARRADHDVAHRHQRAASGRGEIVAGQQRRHPRARRAAHQRRADRARQVERGVERRGVELEAPLMLEALQQALKAAGVGTDTLSRIVVDSTNPRVNREFLGSPRYRPSRPPTTSPPAWDAPASRTPA